MVSKKIIAVVIVIAVLAVGVGVWANGSASTDDSLNGQEVNLAAAASLKNVFDEKLIPMFEEKYPQVEVSFIALTGIVIGCHVGPGTLLISCSIEK